MTRVLQATEGNGKCTKNQWVLTQHIENVAVELGLVSMQSAPELVQQ